MKQLPYLVKMGPGNILKPWLSLYTGMTEEG
jgi:hypothetical protein